jgi:hypothetical protein
VIKILLRQLNKNNERIIKEKLTELIELVHEEIKLYTNFKDHKEARKLNNLFHLEQRLEKVKDKYFNWHDHYMKKHRGC